jgi:phosphohistidine phosphatase SixA
MYLLQKKLFVFVFLVGVGLKLGAQQTTIWVVRHAEKDTAAAAKMDPPLSALGEQRVKDLTAYLAHVHFDNIFSTDTKRTRATAAAVSAPLLIYSARSFSDLATTIMPEFKGKKILIVGHSNTVLETIEALGGKRPIAALTDDDYDYIFKLTIDTAGKLTVDMAHFGAVHRKQ